jgi:hypothetical protein
MGGGQPSFSVPAGERAALQMPGVGEAMTRAFAARERLMNLADPQLGSVPPPPNIKDWFMKNAYDPPGFRDMPRYGGSRYEKDTQYIAPPARPEETPYPRPPWLNFSNWMDTGERGPLPLDARRPGNYPAPANRQMPEAYDARTSGGFLADAGRAAARGVAGQPLAQMSGPYAPMQNVTNTMMLAEAAKTDDERARERMRPVLDEAAQAALEPLMMRKYAEKMGYMPTPSVWKRIWRSIVDNYSGSQGGLTRVR